MVKNILRVDIDEHIEKWDGWLDSYKKMVKATCREFGLEVEDIIVKKSDKRGLHVWVHTKGRELEPREIVKLQWLINDCFGRTLINMRRIERGTPWEINNKIFSKVLWRRPKDHIKNRAHKLLSKEKLSKDERKWLKKNFDRLWNAKQRFKQLLDESREMMKK